MSEFLTFHKMMRAAACSVVLAGCVPKDPGSSGGENTGTTSGNTLPTLVPPRTTVNNAVRCVLGQTLEGCYQETEMQAFYDKAIPFVEGFVDATYTSMSKPAYIFVPDGQTSEVGCMPNQPAGNTTDQDYQYCPAVDTIYLGQQRLWHIYQQDGDAAAVFGLAHEFGHHIQDVAGVPFGDRAWYQANIVATEDQADCIGGAWLGYANSRGWLEYPDDIQDLDSLVVEIADAERTAHGTLAERTAAIVDGFQNGINSCNEYVPSYPIITVSG